MENKNISVKQKLSYQDLEQRIAVLEERLSSTQELLDKSIDVIWKMDLQFRFTYISPSVFSATGYKQEEYVGTKLSSHASFSHFIGMAKTAFKVLKNIQSGADFEVFEAVILDKNGRKIDVEIAGKVHLNQYNIPIGFIGSTRVITDRKNAEREIEAKTQQLKDSNLAKSKFFSIVAHDLRNPFNALLGFSDLLQDEVRQTSNDAIIKYSSLINQTLVKSYDYLNNLLEWSSLQSGVLDYSPTSFLASTLIQEVLDLLLLQSKGKNINMLVHIPTSAVLFADRNMIKIVLINLVSNAIKYSQCNSEIHIDCVQKQDKMRCSVSDTGVGIDSLSCQKLFDIHHSNSTPGTKNELGTGLGLILCKEFIKKNNGQIGVESKLGKGTRFWFEIPIAY